MADFDPNKLKHKPSPKHTLEEVLKSLQDLIRNDLLDAKSAAGKPGPAPGASSDAGETAQRGVAAEKPALEDAAPAREDFAPAAPDSGPVNLNAVMRSLKDLVTNELNTGEQPAPAIEAEPETIEAPPPPFDAQHAKPVADETVPEEYTLEDLAPLDEELTLDAQAEAIPAAPPTSTLFESPANMPRDVIVESEPTSPAKADNSGPGKPGRATQQELQFDAPPPPLVEARLPPSEPMPAAHSTNIPVPDIETIPLKSANPPPASEDPLPTIDVEETFDAGAYFDSTPGSAAITTAEIEISAVETAETGLTLESSPADAPPPDANTTLELAPEPTLENTLAMPTVDIDAVDSRQPPEQTSAPPTTGEPSSPESSPNATAAASRTGAMAPTSPAPNTWDAPENEAIATAADDSMPPTPGAGTAPEDTTRTVSPPAATSSSFNLDDIPILKEVVATPAGSTLLSAPPAPPSPPPRPSPDRARDVVVRAIAKLNIEMRRSGGVGLDTKTILRLQQLIREELEKGGEK